jgi:hypothetical protein
MITMSISLSLKQDHKSLAVPIVISAISRSVQSENQLRQEIPDTPSDHFCQSADIFANEQHQAKGGNA